MLLVTYTASGVAGYYPAYQLHLPVGSSLARRGTFTQRQQSASAVSCAHLTFGPHELARARHLLSAGCGAQHSYAYSRWHDH